MYVINHFGPDSETYRFYSVWRHMILFVDGGCFSSKLVNNIYMDCSRTMSPSITLLSWKCDSQILLCQTPDDFTCKWTGVTSGMKVLTFFNDFSWLFSLDKHFNFQLKFVFSSKTISISLPFCLMSLADKWHITNALTLTACFSTTKDLMARMNIPLADNKNRIPIAIQALQWNSTHKKITFLWRYTKVTAVTHQYVIIIDFMHYSKLL